MATDIQDFTSAVNVLGGTVSITGIASVSISGTPTVNINAGQSIAISGTPSVSISGTPSVSISGTPTVILGAGTASVGSISAIGSTVTVAGTINIGNTPAVTISGTPTVNIGNTPSVSISGTPTVVIGTGANSIGSVSITGTVTVSISGTPNVSIVGSVTIGGTPNVNIQSQSVTVNVNQLQTLLGSGNQGAGLGPTNVGPFTLPVGCHTIAILLSGSGATLGVQGHATATSYWGAAKLAVGAYFATVNQALDAQIDVFLTTPTAATNWSVAAVLDTQEVVLPAVYSRDSLPNSPVGGWAVMVAVEDSGAGGNTADVVTIPTATRYTEAGVQHRSLDVTTYPPSGPLVATFNASVAAGATLTLAAAVGGKVNFPKHLHIEQPAAAAAGANQLDDDLGVTLALFRSEMAGIRDMPFGDLPDPSGAGHAIRLKNNGAAAIIWAGYLTYAQR